MGAVGFVPSLLPLRLHPMAVIKVDALNVPIRGPDGFCIRCEPSKIKFLFLCLCLMSDVNKHIFKSTDEPGMFIGLIAQGNASREYHGYTDKVKNYFLLTRKYNIIY